MRRRAPLVETVSVRISEDLAQLIDEYAEQVLQRRVGQDLIVQRSDAVRMVLGRVLRKWKRRRSGP